MYLNEKLWKTSYLLEFWEKNDVKDAFAFSVPVQSEDITYPQRVNETKTFGGAVLEDYGNDVVTITLNGSTLNEDVKIIYKGKNGFDYLSGSEEIFALQKLIEKYGNIENLKDKQVKLYQLSNGGIGGSVAAKSWQVFITALQIKRSKEKPFCYDYTLQCKAFLTSQKNRKHSDLLKGVLDKWSKWKATLESGLERWQKIANVGLNAINEFVAIQNDIKNIISELNTTINKYISILNGVISTSTSAISESISIFEETTDEIVKITSQYFVISILSATNDLVEACDTLKDWWDEFKMSDKYDQIKDNYESVKDELSDNIDVVVAKLKGDYEETASEITQSVSSVTFSVNPGAYGESDEILKTYGTKQIQIKDNETFEKISFDNYGTADYSRLLSLFNSKTDIEVGDTIYLPVLDSNEDTIEGNEIVRTYGVYDNAGVDIGIVDGDISVKNGDLNVKSNVDNLNQAINSRLSTALNNRVRNVLYGIRSNVGDASDVSTSYVVQSVKDTILEDPRVSSVDSLKLEGMGDNLNINVEYTTKDGIKSNYSGVI